MSLKTFKIIHVSMAPRRSTLPICSGVSNPAGLIATPLLARVEPNTPLLCVPRSQRTSFGQSALNASSRTKARKHACDDGEPRLSDSLTIHAWSYVVRIQTAFRIEKRMPRESTISNTSTPTSWLNVQGRGGDTSCVRGLGLALSHPCHRNVFAALV